MKDAEYDRLGFLLDLAFNSLVGELNHTMRKLGLPLNHAQFAILQNLFLKDGQSQNEIARCVNKDRAAISRSLNTLEENGFIIRKAVSGSKNGIYLTEKAINERKLISKAINTAINKGREGMSEEEYENGMDFLRKIYTNISGAILDEDNPI